jgi:hypothetical protein
MKGLSTKVCFLDKLTFLDNLLWNPANAKHKDEIEIVLSSASSMLN